MLVPLYLHDKLVELQQRLNDLEDIEDFAHPEDIGVSIEYLNSSHFD